MCTGASAVLCSTHEDLLCLLQFVQAQHAALMAQLTLAEDLQAHTWASRKDLLCLRIVARDLPL